ncbi:hypothetical protein COCMIDRAFT_110226 [Bipolaris oryzae ATCC 44560]|uniref:SRR1-like domain-containing protein n=1 Tax=Bipolaris oryzae ATCC 44560 TaxID=930090 RepID=W6YWJ7_COCMI|nr:uncharacterized protein COCMIDRAFT_110226 [Bipolaris oryzae ATCC 44560]EUC39899.1 hypothetical protein COCMIDRAFT_110226 [Bipolaris oryzae ATCC 44560]
MPGRNKASGGSGSGRVKRKQIQREDGWTVITHGLSNISLSEKSQGATALPTQIVKDLTAEKLLSDFKTLQERWEDTALAAQVDGVIEGREWAVEEAVCIGIGSFSRDWAHRWRSLWQLVLFEHVVGRLKKSSKKTEIQCYAQDPAFTPLDTEFLSLLSITTLESGLEAKITAKSFVYSPFVDWFLLLPMFLVDRDPVLYVGNEILDDYSMYAQSEEKKEKLQECNEVGKKWLVGREAVKLCEFEKHGNALNGMVVYLRGSEDDEKDGGEDKEEKAQDGEEEKGKVKSS